jgi:excisionase family DNA binding protein
VEPAHETCRAPPSDCHLDDSFAVSPAHQFCVAPAGLQPRRTDPDNLTEPEKVALMNDRKTISIMKACEVVGVSRRTIYNWIASGKVEYIRTAGGSVRIFVDTLWRQPGRADLTSKEAS